MESCDMSTSLFSGMTFTSLPLPATREDLNLKGHTNLMPTKKQLSPTGTLQPSFPDFTTSISKFFLYLYFLVPLILITREHGLFWM